MIKIDINDIDGICSEFANRIKEKKRRSKNRFYLYYQEHINQIITCPAHRLSNIIRLFESEFSQDYINEEWNSFCKYMTGQYNSFIKANGMWLAKALNVSVCPYCNRQYTFTVDQKQKIRPQFDHFYPKSQYPYLALSFYNLIPCCPTCNHTKGNRIIKYNPYIKGFDTDANFRIDRLDKCLMHNENWNIVISNNEQCCSNINVFSLPDLYNQHKDYAQEIVFRAVAYESPYLKAIEKEFGKFDLSESEIERIIWGNYINPDEFGKRPLSKLTHDIIQQVKK